MKGTPGGGWDGLQGDSPNRLLGRVLDDRFAIKSILGVGGMGTVYRAEQFSMHRDVAVKVLRGDIVGDEFAVRRFLTEARAASRLKSPHTVTVFDFGRTGDGILYIAMELMEGRTLAQVLLDEGRPFGLVRATRLINQVLDSIEEAHGVGILHRDLKPDNVFLLEGIGSRDFLKVLDFGVAKMVGETRTVQTVAGLAFGTPIYMSPEQMMGKDVGPDADLYAVAVMLFELLAGKPPLDDMNPVELALHKVDGRLPRLHDVNPEAESGVDLDAFLVRAMAPDPAKRPGDVESFREELNRAVRNATTGPRPDLQVRRGTPVTAGTILGMPVVTISEPEPAPQPAPGPAPQATPRPPQPAPQPVFVTEPTPAFPHPPLPGLVAAPPGVEGARYDTEPTPIHPWPAVAPPEPAPRPATPAPGDRQDEAGRIRTVVGMPSMDRDEPFNRQWTPEPTPAPTAAPTPAAPGPLPHRRELPHRPQPARGDDRRIRPRMAHLSTVTCVQDGARHRALLADVSQVGAFVYSRWLPEPDGMLHLLFQLSEDDDGPAISIVSRVLRVVETRPNSAEAGGFSVKWLVLRTQGPLQRVQAFFRKMFDSDLPGVLPPETDARLWEYRFGEASLSRDGLPVPPA